MVLSLTMTYFHENGSHYHRRGLVSRSCSGWEGVGPRRYGRQTYDLFPADFAGQSKEEVGYGVIAVKRLFDGVFKVIGSSLTGN